MSEKLKHDIWSVDYNETVKIQASKGWNGVLVVILVNSVFFIFSFLVFIYSRSGKSSLYGLGENSPELQSGSPMRRKNETQDKLKVRIVSGIKRFVHFVYSYNDVTSLYLAVGNEGAFYLLYQLYACRLLCGMSMVVLIVLIPVYYGMGHGVWNSFEVFTIRTVPNESGMLWIPVLVCWGFSIAFGGFIARLNALCTNRDANKHHLLCMKPSQLAAKSIFINRGIPKQLNENKMYADLEKLFPGYISHVAVVLNLNEYKSYKKYRIAKEKELERATLTKELKERGKLPRMLMCCPGNGMYPTPFRWFYQVSSEHEERRLLAQIRMLHDAEDHALHRAVTTNAGAGRAFVVFSTPKCRASFVRRVRNTSLDQIKITKTETSKAEARKLLKEIAIQNWKFLPAPEPNDIDWDSVSFPFAQRTLGIVVINVAIVVMLLLFTSPVAITATFSTGKYSGAANFISKAVNNFGDWVAGLSQNISDLIFAFTPTLVYVLLYVLFQNEYISTFYSLVMINATLLNVLYYAGRFQPMHTDSGKEQHILRTSAVYLIFNTLFVPSFAFASIDALIVYLQHRGRVLDVLGTLFLHNSGTFYVNYVIQRAFMGTSINLLRASEGLQFWWFNSRAVTASEREASVAAWPFYSGTQSALQISVLTVVLSFSTVVPVIVPFGAFYMIMQHLVDKYSLLYVRPRIPGRGAICQTATHASIFSLLIYQAGMAGFFAVRGSDLQSSSMVLLVMITYIITLWWYLRDKQSAYQESVSEDNPEEYESSRPLRGIDPTDLYREPALRQAVPNEATHADLYGSILFD